MSLNNHNRRYKCLSRDELLYRLYKLNVEHCEDKCECDTDELQSLYEVYTSDIEDFNRFFELADSCNESLELVQTLVECNDGLITESVLDQLKEQSFDPTLQYYKIQCSKENGVLLEENVEIDISSTIVAIDVLPRKELDEISSTPCVKTVTLHEIESAALRDHSGTTNIIQGIQLLKPPLLFGIHELSIVLQRHIKANEDTSQRQEEYYTRKRVNITSATYRYITALEAMYDRMIWGWEGQWTEELEHALIQLVIAVDDDLTAMVKSMTSMMTIMSGDTPSTVTDMTQLLETVNKDIQLALTQHSTYAIGRLHQTLLQFREIDTMLGAVLHIPETFKNAIDVFILEKLKNSSKMEEINRLLYILVDTSADFLHQFSTTGTTSLMGRIQRFIEYARSIDITPHSTPSSETLYEFLLTTELVLSILQLKPSSMELMATASIATWSPQCINYMPYIPVEYAQNRVLLHQCARKLSETLLMDVINVHSFMGYSITPANISDSAVLILSLLDAGFAYVCSESGKLMALLPIQRSLLVLNRYNPSYRDDSSCSDVNTLLHSNGAVNMNNSSTDASTLVQIGNISPEQPAHTSAPSFMNEWLPSTEHHIHSIESFHKNNNLCTLPLQLRKRAKDMHRIYRNNVKRRLSLRLNTNIDVAIAHLRAHHQEDCWIGGTLESVWKYMAATNPLQLLIFELYYGEDLIAADFTHPVNQNSIYVATRFYNKNIEYKKLMPGFMLALAEIHFLKQLGVNIWDLGTVNLCPLMRYKLDLTGTPLSRSEALYEHICASNTGATDSTSSDSGSCNSNSSVVYEKRLCTLTSGVLVENLTPADLL